MGVVAGSAAAIGLAGLALVMGGRVYSSKKERGGGGGIVIQWDPSAAADAELQDVLDGAVGGGRQGAVQIGSIELVASNASASMAMAASNASASIAGIGQGFCGGESVSTDLSEDVGYRNNRG